MKYCQRCGFQNDDSAGFCSRCGNSLAASAGNSTVVVVGGSGQQAPVGSNPGTLWMVLNIVLTLLCCSVLSIIGIIFGAMAMSKFNNGVYAEAKSNANVSKILFIIGLILGVLSLVGVIIYCVLMGGIAALPLLGTYFSGLGYQ